VPLSEHEQRLFEEIERSLADDPKFASAVRANDPRHHARRRLVIAGIILVVGLGVLVAGAMLHSTLLGVIGFVIMLAGPAFALQSRRRTSGRRGRGHLRVVGGSSRRPRRSTTSLRRGGSWLDRLEDRWRNRPEGHR
jgi:predicted lipid-binding transport protein (Tim44 family)